MKKIVSIIFALLICSVGEAQIYSTELENKANAGHAREMLDLGECYYWGFGINKKRSSARKWFKKAFLAFKKAAENGDEEAMSYLGYCYQYGKGVNISKSKALYWYVKGVEYGSPEAMNNLGYIYENGYCGVKEDSKTADILYSARDDARSGNTRGATQLLSQKFPSMKIRKIDVNNPPIIQIVPGSIIFADASENNAIDANEISSVRFKVENKGKGPGYDCLAKVKTFTDVITGGEKKIREIKAGQIIDVEIPITSKRNTIDGTTDIEVSVFEPNNFGCDPVMLTVNTKAFVAPMLKIVDYAISNESGGKLRKMMPFNLQMILQNTEFGNAENINVSISIPDNVILMDGDKKHYFENLSAGGKKDLNYTLIANNAYTAETIPVTVSISEKYGKYAESSTINLKMNQSMSAQRIVIDENDNLLQNNIEIAQIEGKLKASDVDVDIPATGKIVDNTFAVIIANENYRQESNVDYALNDGATFGVYCNKVLGLPKENVRVLMDATLNEIRGGVNWLKKVAEAYRGEANLIFYYAGHGVPDEKSKDAFLLPIDGFGNDLVTAYKMEDLYTNLSSCPSNHTLVFLDACFSGKQRSGEEMATARAVGISTKNIALKGNMVVFSAAQGDEIAYPYIDKQHGMFTYFLLKKLKESEGNVTLGELGRYIKDNVLRKSVVTNTKSQTPSVNPSSSMLNKWKDIKL